MSPFTLGHSWRKDTLIVSFRNYFLSRKLLCISNKDKRAVISILSNAVSGNHPPDRECLSENEIRRWTRIDSNARWSCGNDLLSRIFAMTRNGIANVMVSFDRTTLSTRLSSILSSYLLFRLHSYNLKESVRTRASARGDVAEWPWILSLLRSVSLSRWMTDGDSCCIAVVAKNISPVTTLSLLFFHLYLGTSLFRPSPRAVVPCTALSSSSSSSPRRRTPFRFVLLAISCCRYRLCCRCRCRCYCCCCCCCCCW